MPLGGLAPLPLPLGGTAVDGLTAEQHARLAADLFAATQTGYLGVLRYKTAAGAAAVLAYLGQHGVGLAAAPTVTYAAIGEVFVTWKQAYTDEYNQTWPLNIRGARALPCMTDPQAAMSIRTTVQRQSANQLLVQCFDIATNAPRDSAVAVFVW